MSDGSGAARLRRALRETGGTQSGRQAAVDKAFAPLYKFVAEPLLRQCRRLAASESRLRLDAEDLAQSAWEKTLAYLSGPSGDRVQDDAHLLRFLLITANRLFLDVKNRAEAQNPALEINAPLRVNGAESAELTLGDSLAGRDEGPGDAPFLRSGFYLGLVEEMFGDTEAFGERAKAVGRHPRVFRAFTLYHLTALFRSEALDGKIPPGLGDASFAKVLRNWATLLLPAEDWALLEWAAWKSAEENEAREETLYPRLRDAVNALCKTTLRNRSQFQVVATQLRQIAKEHKEKRRDTEKTNGSAG